MALFLVRVGSFLVKKSDPGSWYHSPSASMCQMAVRMESSMATMAFSLPRRTTIRL